MMEGEHELLLTVVVPARNEALNLPVTIEEVRSRLTALGVSFEILIVDDASTDDSARVVAELVHQDSRIRASLNPAHLGISGTFRNGVRLARGEFVILIPADLGMDPDQISDFIGARRRADIVVGIRSDRRDSSSLRKIVSVTNILMIRLLFRMPQRQFNFITMYRRAVFDRLEFTSSTVFFHAEILIRARDLGLRIEELDVRYLPRRFGRSSSGRPGALVGTFLEMVGFWWSRRRPKVPFAH